MCTEALPTVWHRVCRAAAPGATQNPPCARHKRACMCTCSHAPPPHMYFATACSCWSQVLHQACQPYRMHACLATPSCRPLPGPAGRSDLEVPLPCSASIDRVVCTHACARHRASRLRFLVSCLAISQRPHDAPGPRCSCSCSPAPASALLLLRAGAGLEIIFRSETCLCHWSDKRKGGHKSIAIVSLCISELCRMRLQRWLRAHVGVHGFPPRLYLHIISMQFAVIYIIAEVRQYALAMCFRCGAEPGSR